MERSREIAALRGHQPTMIHKRPLKTARAQDTDSHSILSSFSSAFCETLSIVTPLESFGPASASYGCHSHTASQTLCCSSETRNISRKCWESRARVGGLQQLFGEGRGGWEDRRPSKALPASFKFTRCIRQCSFATPSPWLKLDKHIL